MGWREGEIRHYPWKVGCKVTKPSLKLVTSACDNVKDGPPGSNHIADDEKLWVSLRRSPNIDGYRIIGGYTATQYGVAAHRAPSSICWVTLVDLQLLARCGYTDAQSAHADGPPQLHQVVKQLPGRKRLHSGAKTIGLQPHCRSLYNSRCLTATSALSLLKTMKAGRQPLPAGPDPDEILPSTKFTVIRSSDLWFPWLIKALPQALRRFQKFRVSTRQAPFDPFPPASRRNFLPAPKIV